MSEKVKKPKHKHYVNSKDFENQIEAFYKTGDITPELGQSIYNIAHRLGFAPNFINYTYKEEMVGDALIKMFAALNNKKFDIKKGNPFSYFTKIAFNAYRNRIKKEKKNRETLMTYQDEIYSTLMDLGQLPPDDHHNKHYNNDEKHDA